MGNSGTLVPVIIISFLKTQQILCIVLDTGREKQLLLTQGSWHYNISTISVTRREICCGRGEGQRGDCCVAECQWNESRTSYQMWLWSLGSSNHQLWDFGQVLSWKLNFYICKMRRVIETTVKFVVRSEDCMKNTRKYLFQYYVANHLGQCLLGHYLPPETHIWDTVSPTRVPTGHDLCPSSSLLGWIFRDTKLRLSIFSPSLNAFMNFNSLNYIIPACLLLVRNR